MVKRIVNGEIVDEAAPPKTTKLLSAHRSIRQAHAISLLMILGIVVLWLPIITYLLGTAWRYPALLFCGATYQARFGAAWVHSLVPPLLREGQPPKPDEVSQASPGLFTLDAFQNPTGRGMEEWESFLENTAFVCTYGKTNCLTSQMYAGEITLGKIVSLVSDKLSQGTFACR